MKTKKTFFSSVLSTLFLMFFVTLNSFALDYTITFTASGASATVGSVFVQNLTKGTTVTIPAGNTLNLTDVVTSVHELIGSDHDISVNQSLKQGKSMLSFFAKQAGNVQIIVFGIDGKIVISCSKILLEGHNSFILSLPKGAYAINVVGNGYVYNAKMLNISDAEAKSEIAFLGNRKTDISVLQKAKNAVTPMLFTAGDRLLYKGISDNFSTVVVDVPDNSKNTNFEFVACKDADNNNYTVVKIGTQTWMAENLKTTKYRDAITVIPNITDNATWAALVTDAWCYYNNNEANNTVYGKLYNWNAIINSNNLCPSGWHVPSNAEWTTLTNFLTNNGYGYQGSGDDIAKSMSTTSGWRPFATVGTVGNDQTSNNSSGFTALQGAYRNYGDGTFNDFGNAGGWWSSTEYSSGNAGSAYVRYIYYYYGTVSGGSVSKAYGFSVRCVKD